MHVEKESITAPIIGAPLLQMSSKRLPKVMSCSEQAPVLEIWNRVHL